MNVFLEKIILGFGRIAHIFVTSCENGMNKSALEGVWAVRRTEGNEDKTEHAFHETHICSLNIKTL